METLEAIALDNQYLKLKEPLPKNIGNRFLIRILAPRIEHSHQLKQLEQAYLTMTDKEKKKEISFAEEGLQIQAELSEQFPDEEEQQWWE